MIRGLSITSGNDAPDRDPTSFVLEGSQNGSDFQWIAEGSIPEFSDRLQTHYLSFENDKPYRVYRLVFPTVNGTNCCMQIQEIELLGEILPADALPPLIIQQPQDVFAEEEGSATFCASNSWTRRRSNTNGMSMVSPSLVPTSLVSL